jgi:hypothetical protein
VLASSNSIHAYYSTSCISSLPLSPFSCWLWRSRHSCLQVTRPIPPPAPCAATVALDIIPTPRRAARGSLIVWNVTLTPRNGTVFDVNISNPIPNTLSTPAIIRQPVGGSCRFAQANGQSVLHCSIASISGPVVVQYSTRAHVADTITSVVEAKYKACRNSPAVVTERNNIVVIWVSS